MKYIKGGFATALAGWLFCSLLSSANVVGTGAQNFNSITSGLDFVTVQSSETLKPGILNFGLFFNYAINSLPYLQDIPQGRTEFNDALFGADFNFGLGLLENWDMGMSFPFVLAQTVNANKTFRGEFSKNGNTEIRINTKYRLLGKDDQGVAIVGSVNFNRISNNPYKGSPSNPSYNLEIIADRTFGPVAVGINFGHRWMLPGPAIAGAPIVPLSNQWIASTAASYLIPNSDTKVVFELFGSIPAQTRNSDQNRAGSSFEALLGGKHDLNHHLSIHAGLGTELIHGVSSPDWRVYTGINYNLGPLFSKEQSEGISYIKKSESTSERFVVRKIHFEFDSEKMVGQYKEALDEVIAYLNTIGRYRKIVIEGHTDSIGSEVYNLDLSSRRAKAISKVLAEEYHLEKTKIEAVGFGETHPIADNGNFQGRQENRRVEFEIIR